MAIPITSVTVAQIILKSTLTAAGGVAKQVQLTFYYRRTAVTVAPTKAALATVFAAGPLAAMIAAFNVRWNGSTINVRWLNDATDPTVVIADAGVGAIATDMMPTYVAVFLKLGSALRGKTYRSSKHMPAVNEIDTTGDVLTGAGLTRWQAVQTALLVPLVDATPNTWNLTVFSPKLSQVKSNPTTVTVNDVTTIVLDRSVGTMRRRKVKTVI